MKLDRPPPSRTTAPMWRSLLTTGLCTGWLACTPVASGPTVEPDLAQKIAQKQTEIQSGDPKAWVELGQLHLEAEQYFHAADAFTKAKEVLSNDVRVHAGLALSYVELGYIKSSVENMRACFALDRNQADCLYALGKLLERDPSERAQREVQRTWRHLLIAAPGYKHAAYVRSALTQLDAKLGPAQEQPRSQPASQPAQAQNTPEKPAEKVPEHSVKDDPNAPKVGELNPFGQAIREAFQAVQGNDAPAAIEAFGRALKIRPGDAGAQAGLAEAYFAMGNMKKAMELVDAAYKAHPKDAQVRWVFGLIMLKNRTRIPEALAAWKALAKDEPEYAKQLKVAEQLEEIEKLAKGTGESPH